MSDGQWVSVKKGEFGWWLSEGGQVMALWMKKLPPEGQPNRFSEVLARADQHESAGDITIGEPFRLALKTGGGISAHAIAETAGGGFMISFWPASVSEVITAGPHTLGRQVAPKRKWWWPFGNARP
jgi:hypothetical protein